MGTPDFQAYFEIFLIIVLYLLFSGIIGTALGFFFGFLGYLARLTSDWE